MKICVLGLGYIGLPTASILASNGYKVAGVDVNENIVNKINRGNIHIEEPGLKTLVMSAINSGNLIAYKEPQNADVFIIAVPTPINEDKTADLSYIQNAAESLIGILKKGDTVILESTSPPGTTEEFLVPILEKSGLKIGEELYLAHCPERVLPGKIIKELIQNNRIIGGINTESALKAKELYKTFVEGEIKLTTATTAEMAKVMENTFRDVNIALANELAKICDQINISSWEVIELANLHPRVNLHKPGPGVGGHCISVDPWFLINKFNNITGLIKQARHINDSMPYYTIELIKDAVKEIKNPNVTILGVSYKADVDDCREAPSEIIIEELKKESDIEIRIYDPHVKDYKWELSNFENAFRDTDCIVVAVDHTEFKYIDPECISKIIRNKLVIDTKNTLDQNKWETNGFRYILLGGNRANGSAKEQVQFSKCPF